MKPIKYTPIHIHQLIINLTLASTEIVYYAGQLTKSVKPDLIKPFI